MSLLNQINLLFNLTKKMVRKVLNLRSTALGFNRQGTSLCYLVKLLIIRK